MKQILSITLFMICLLLFTPNLSASTKAKANLKTQNQVKTETSTSTVSKAAQLSLQQLQVQWEAMFSVPRGNSCTIDLTKPDMSSENDPSAGVDSDAKKSGWGLVRPNFKWIKKWGFEGSAYLIDYLDPLFQKDFKSEASAIITQLGKLSRNDDSNYFDKFNIKFIAPKENKLASDADFKAINPGFSKEIYDKAFNTCQLNQAILNWGWYQQQDEQDPAYNFVAKYDLNGDGRLDYMELILGVIWHNKKRDGLYCYNCFFLLAKRLGAIFNFLDCQSKGYLTAEELWTKLPNLKRATSQWNIFKHNTLDTIRTQSINDFILKNGYTVDGGVTRNEFISGVLLGLWNRNIDEKSILSDEKRSQKNLRWSSNGMDDTAANEYLLQSK